jgi:Ca2+-binding EF-hand superfamily protein
MPMKRVLFYLFALLMLLALPCLAAAKPEKGMKDPFMVSFSQIDQNADGVIVLAEFVAVFPKGGKELFALADKDKNGKLSKEELKAWQDKYGKQEPEAMAVHYVVIDQDNNGEVTVNEFVAVFGPKSKEVFDKADKNHDGKLSKEEWEDWKSGKK